MAKQQRSGEAILGAQLTADKPLNTAGGKPPSEQEQARIREALGRWVGRRSSVTVAAKRDANGKLNIGPSHDDLAGFAARLSDAVGSGSTSFALRQLDLLGAMVANGTGNPERALNSLLAAVEGVQPESEVEGMLAVQMAATHEAAMACLGRAQRAATVEQMEASGNLATKLLRTYIGQFEALAKIRRGGEQKVRVEHVHVHAGGQAIVGRVEAQGGGGLLENGRQPHALTGPAAFALSPDPPLLRDDAEGVRMHGAGNEGQEPVSHARRGERQRGAQG